MRQALVKQSLESEDSLRIVPHRAVKETALLEAKTLSHTELHRSNRAKTTNFLNAQTIVLECMIHLGYPLIDFLESGIVERPKVRKTGRERKAARESESISGKGGSKHRQGDFQWENLRRLQLLVSGCGTACSIGDNNRMILKLVQLEEFLKQYDFSLIQKIMKATMEAKPRASYESIWSKHAQNVSFERLHSAYKDAVKIRDELVEDNQALAYRVATYYSYRRSGDLYEMDTKQQALIGLSVGIGKLPFESEDKKSISLSTVAKQWITHHVTRWLQNNGSTIKVPPCQVKQMSMLREFADNYLEENGDYPSLEEVKAHFPSLPEKKAATAYRGLLAQATTSLNVKVGGDESLEVGDFMMDNDRHSDTANVVESNDSAEMVNELLADMPSPERFVVTAQMGMADITNAGPSLISEMLEKSKLRSKRLVESVAKNQLIPAKLTLNELASSHLVFKVD